MKLRELLDKFADFIDNNRENITKFLLVILASISLMIVFFISSDEMSISKEVDHLVKNIESRKYQIAYDYYEGLKTNFSDSKMKRFNKSVSKKINSVIINNGDKYINGQITKEQYIGLINTTNALSEISINVENLIEQAKRVDEMYLQENISYDVALSYMNIASSLNGVNEELDDYKQNIKDFYESRAVYEEATNNQQVKKYHEAIEGYNKVSDKDKKYYKLAKMAKEECINIMYDYYIQKAIEANEKGNYDEAIKYISYLKPYYQDDEKIASLESEYQENLELYTMSTDDIIGLISKKMESGREGISINSYQQMINGGKFYYVELYKYDTLIDEILVDSKTKKIYSYKSNDKDYDATYSDGYFKVTPNGEFRFALSEGECSFALENKLKEKDETFKRIEIVSDQNSNKYVKNNQVLKDFLKSNKNAYYYALVNKGFFKKKELYFIDMYTKNIYKVENDKVVNY